MIRQTMNRTAKIPANTIVSVGKASLRPFMPLSSSKLTSTHKAAVDISDIPRKKLEYLWQYGYNAKDANKPAVR